MLAAEKHKATFIAPIGIGLVLFVCQLLGTLWTGCGMNPARSFGPSVTSASFPVYHWIYWIGPYIGAIIAVGFYTLLKAFDYGSVVLGQDSDDTTQSPEPVPVYSKMWRARNGFTGSQREALIETGMEKDQVDMAERGMMEQASKKLAVNGNGNGNGINETPVSQAVSAVQNGLGGAGGSEGSHEPDVGQVPIERRGSMFPMTSAIGQDVGGMSEPHTHDGYVNPSIIFFHAIQWCLSLPQYWIGSHKRCIRTQVRSWSENFQGVIWETI